MSSWSLVNRAALDALVAGASASGDREPAPLARPVRAGLPGWFFTVHALHRMAEMLVARGEVLAALDDPQVAYPARGDRLMSVRGRLAVVSAQRVVVTVLWHTGEIYHRADSACSPTGSRGPAWPVEAAAS
jgi:hypothetical protein